MTKFDYDLFVIGTGEAGSSAAGICSSAGWKVAIADDNPFGGTCSLRGCNPKRTLAGAAELIYRSRGMIGNGIDGDLQLNWSRLIEFKEKLNEGISERHEKNFYASGIDMYHGFVTFSGIHEVAIGNKKISTRNILIATGSKPHTIGIPGEEYMVTSDQLLALKRLPSRILFVGAGYISMEFSHVLAASGAHVTLLEYAPSPLMKFDRDLVTMLLKESRNHGIEIWASRKVKKIEKVGNEFSVMTEGESEKVFKADLVAHGAGRIPNIENLKLENAEINYEKYRIKVNPYLQSISNSNVYVAGDAHAEGIQLTPVAEMEGKIAAYNMLHGNVTIPDYTAIPSIVFTHPGLAAVGESANLADLSDNTEIIFQDTSAKHITKRLGLTASAFKVIVDKTTRRVRGAHMIGHNIDEVINLFSLIIRTGITIETIKDMPWTFPSVTYDTIFRL